MDNLDFLNAIASGFNPYTGEKFSDSDILLSLQVSKRLNNLVQELNEYRTDEKATKRNAIEIFYPHTSIQPFAKAISYAIYGALKFGTIQNRILEYLLEDKKLEFKYPYQGSQRMKKFATKDGEMIGIINAVAEDPYGKFKHIVYYLPQAQMYIIDRLSEILKDDDNY